MLDADGLSLSITDGGIDCDDDEVGPKLGDLEGCGEGCRVGFLVGCKLQ